MKGIVLAGGTGSRLRPLTDVMNKNLLPVGDKPMILYPINKLKKSGIEDIVIITGTEHAGAVVNLLGSGKKYDVNLTYRIQDEPKGIAQAIGLAEEVCCGHHTITILGDNIFESDLNDMTTKMRDNPKNAVVLTTHVSDPERFGVAEYDETSNIIGIHEKPKNPPSNDAVIGVYAYPPDVFDIIKDLKPSMRGEYEVTDLSNHYLKQNRLSYSRIDGFWIDAGTPDTLKAANMWAYKSM